MAMSLTGLGRGGEKNLTCGVCREVYRSPRLLPCFHTFCLHCVEGLARTHGGYSFPCPQCRKPTTVPSEGALGFQTNFYITEQELELERKGPWTIRCNAHVEEPLVLFCVQCDCAICIFCKLTKHENHETEELSKAAARCQSELEKSKERLEDTISYLSKMSAAAQENLKAAEKKGILMKKQVQAQHDALVSKVGKIRDAVLTEIDTCNSAVKDQLTVDVQTLQQELDSLLQLRQRLHHSTGEASDAEKVCVEKEMRKGKGSEERLNEAKANVPVTTKRLGLHCNTGLVSEDDIHQFFGNPAELSLPFANLKESIIPIFHDRDSSEVTDVCYINSGKIFISALEKNLAIDTAGLVIDQNRDGRQSYKRYSDGSCFRSSYEYGNKDENRMHGFRLNAKGKGLFQVKYNSSGISGIYRTEIIRKKPFKAEQHLMFDTNPEKPAAFDATETGELFAIVEEKPAQLPKDTKKRTMCLYRKGKKTPFATYTPSDAAFDPADVCFWEENGQTKLLVADPQNDCVHIVNIEDDKCRFERYLAAGSDDLVRPTALNTDDQGNVWIGCGNGWILKCEKLPDFEESPCDESNDASVLSADSDVVSESDLLMVQIPSLSTDVQSQMSQ